MLLTASFGGRKPKPAVSSSTLHDIRMKIKKIASMLKENKYGSMLVK
jgi:hypothetical protein